MSEITLNLGPISIPENRIWKAICWIPRKLAGTQMLCDQLKGVTNHVSAMTDILHIVIADLTAKWPQEKRERVQRHIANFRILKGALDELQPEGNPFTAEEVRKLQYYTQKAQLGETFQVEEAEDYRQLSERAALEYPGQDWVKELLKVAIFIFALYVLSKVLNPESS